MLDPRKEAVLSTEVDSAVRAVRKEFGQAFKKGDVLILLDSRLYNLRLEKAKALYKKASAKHDVIAKLYAQKARSIVDLEEAKAELIVLEPICALPSRKYHIAPFVPPIPVGWKNWLCMNANGWKRNATR